MIDQAKAEAANINVKKNTNRFIIHNIIELFESSWYWIVLSLILCLSVAWLKLQMSPNIYAVSATMQINTPSTQINNDVMKMFRSPSNAEREIHFFTSRQVVQDVVSDLNLNVTYTKPGLFLDEDLYDKSPIDAYFVGNNYPDCRFEIECHPDEYILTAIEDEKGCEGAKWTAKYDDTLVTHKGVVVIKKRPNATEVAKAKFLIDYVTPDKATAQYMGKMGAAIVDEDAGNIALSIRDVNYQRGVIVPRAGA